MEIALIGCALFISIAVILFIAFDSLLARMEKRSMTPRSLNDPTQGGYRGSAPSRIPQRPEGAAASMNPKQQRQRGGSAKR